MRKMCDNDLWRPLLKYKDKARKHLSSRDLPGCCGHIQKKVRELPSSISCARVKNSGSANVSNNTQLGTTLTWIPSRPCLLDKIPFGNCVVWLGSSCFSHSLGCRSRKSKWHVFQSHSVTVTKSVFREERFYLADTSRYSLALRKAEAGTQAETMEENYLPPHSVSCLAGFLSLGLLSGISGLGPPVSASNQDDFLNRHSQSLPESLS